MSRQGIVTRRPNAQVLRRCEVQVVQGPGHHPRLLRARGCGRGVHPLQGHWLQETGHRAGGRTVRPANDSPRHHYREGVRVPPGGARGARGHHLRGLPPRQAAVAFAPRTARRLAFLRCVGRFHYL